MRPLAVVLVVLALAASARAEQTWPELAPHPRRVERDRSAQLALEAARPELVRCLAAAPVSRLYVQARVSPRHPLRISIGPRPLPPELVACAEAAARRHLVPLAARTPARFSVGRVEVGARPRRSTSPSPDLSARSPVRPPPGADFVARVCDGVSAIPPRRG